MNEICLSCGKHTKCGRAEHETIGCGYYVPMTNEEYLKSCNTEQLAEWIAHQTMIALLENQNNHSLRMTYPAYWVEWLKQPHTFK